MTLSSLLTPDQQTIGPADFVPSTFGQIASSAFGEAMVRIPFSIPAFIDEADSFKERDDLVMQTFGVGDSFDVIDPERMKEINKLFLNPKSKRLPVVKAKQEALDATIMERRKTDSRYENIKTTAEIKEQQKNIARTLTTESREIASRGESALGTLGASLVGGIAALPTDPLQLALLPVGAASSASVLKAMAIESVLAAGVEVAETPSKLKWQKELGFRYGLGDAALDVGLAGVGGAAFTGLIRGAGGAIKAVGSRSSKILDDLAQSPNISAEFRDALIYQSRVAHLDEDVPKVGPLTLDDISVQRSALKETQDAINNYRTPNLEFARTHFKLSDVNFRSVGVVSDKNTAKAFKNSEIPALIHELQRFTSRKQADTFIRAKAVEFNQPRTDFIIEKTPDGKTVVLRKDNDTFVKRNDTGDAILFPSREKAQEAIDISKTKDLNQHILSVTAEDGKASQVHLVLQGKKLTKQDVKLLKEKPDFLSFIDPVSPTRTLEVKGLGKIRNVVDPNNQASSIVSMGQKADIHALMEKSTKDGSDPILKQVEESELQRLIDEDGDLLVPVDGGKKPLRDIVKGIDDDADRLIRAIEGCSIG